MIPYYSLNLHKFKFYLYKFQISKLNVLNQQNIKIEYFFIDNLIDYPFPAEYCYQKPLFLVSEKKPDYLYQQNSPFGRNYYTPQRSKLNLSNIVYIRTEPERSKSFVFETPIPSKQRLNNSHHMYQRGREGAVLPNSVVLPHNVVLPINVIIGNMNIQKTIQMRSQGVKDIDQILENQFKKEIITDKKYVQEITQIKNDLEKKVNEIKIINNYEIKQIKNDIHQLIEDFQSQSSKIKLDSETRDLEYEEQRTDSQKRKQIILLDDYEYQIDEEEYNNNQYEINNNQYQINNNQKANSPITKSKQKVKNKAKKQNLIQKQQIYDQEEYNKSVNNNLNQLNTKSKQNKKNQSNQIQKQQIYDQEEYNKSVNNNQYLINNNQYQINNNQYEINNNQYEIKNNQNDINNNQKTNSSIIKSEKSEQNVIKQQKKQNFIQQEYNQDEFNNNQQEINNNQYEINNNQKTNSSYIKSEQNQNVKKQPIKQEYNNNQDIDQDPYQNYFNKKNKINDIGIQKIQKQDDKSLSFQQYKDAQNPPQKINNEEINTKLKIIAQKNFEVNVQSLEKSRTQEQYDNQILQYYKQSSNKSSNSPFRQQTKNTPTLRNCIKNKQENQIKIQQENLQDQSLQSYRPEEIDEQQDQIQPLQTSKTQKYEKEVSPSKMRQLQQQNKQKQQIIGWGFTMDEQKSDQDQYFQPQISQFQLQNSANKQKIIENQIIQQDYIPQLFDQQFEQEIQQQNLQNSVQNSPNLILNKLETLNEQEESFSEISQQIIQNKQQIYQNIQLIQNNQISDFQQDLQEVSFSQQHSEENIGEQYNIQESKTQKIYAQEKQIQDQNFQNNIKKQYGIQQINDKYEIFGQNNNQILQKINKISKQNFNQIQNKSKNYQMRLQNVQNSNKNSDKKQNKQDDDDNQCEKHEQQEDQQEYQEFSYISQAPDTPQPENLDEQDNKQQIPFYLVYEDSQNSKLYQTEAQIQESKVFDTLRPETLEEEDKYIQKTIKKNEYKQQLQQLKQQMQQLNEQLKEIKSKPQTQTEQYIKQTEESEQFQLSDQKQEIIVQQVQQYDNSQISNISQAPDTPQNETLEDCQEIQQDNQFLNIQQQQDEQEQNELIQQKDQKENDTSQISNISQAPDSPKPESLEKEDNKQQILYTQFFEENDQKQEDQWIFVKPQSIDNSQISKISQAPDTPQPETLEVDNIQEYSEQQAQISLNIQQNIPQKMTTIKVEYNQQKIKFSIYCKQRVQDAVIQALESLQIDDLQTQYALFDLEGFKLNPNDILENIIKIDETLTLKKLPSQPPTQQNNASQPEKLEQEVKGYQKQENIASSIQSPQKSEDVQDLTEIQQDHPMEYEELQEELQIELQEELLEEHVSEEYEDQAQEEFLQEEHVQDEINQQTQKIPETVYQKVIQPVEVSLWDLQQSNISMQQDLQAISQRNVSLQLQLDEINKQQEPHLEFEQVEDILNKLLVYRQQKQIEIEKKLFIFEQEKQKQITQSLIEYENQRQKEIEQNMVIYQEERRKALSQKQQEYKKQEENKKVDVKTVAVVSKAPTPVKGGKVVAKADPKSTKKIPEKAKTVAQKTIPLTPAKTPTPAKKVPDNSKAVAKGNTSQVKAPTKGLTPAKGVPTVGKGKEIVQKKVEIAKKPAQVPQIAQILLPAQSLQPKQVLSAFDTNKASLFQNIDVSPPPDIQVKTLNPLTDAPNNIAVTTFIPSIDTNTTVSSTTLNHVTDTQEQIFDLDDQKIKI